MIDTARSAQVQMPPVIDIVDQGEVHIRGVKHSEDNSSIGETESQTVSSL